MARKVTLSENDTQPVWPKEEFSSLMQEVLHTEVNAALKSEPYLGKGVKVRRYLGGDMSFSFSEAGSPPTPQCVLGIS
jgi:hypothetical protein